MIIQTLDTGRLRRPNTIVKIVKQAAHMKPVSILEVRGDCPSFEKDVRTWCKGTGRMLLSVEIDEYGTKIIRIQF